MPRTRKTSIRGLHRSEQIDALPSEQQKKSVTQLRRQTFEKEEHFIATRAHPPPPQSKKNKRLTKDPQ